MHLDLSLASTDTLPSVLAIAGAVGSGWIYTIFIGLIIGFVAKLLTPGKEPAGFLITVIIGIAGSVLAYYLGKAIGWYGEGETPGFIASVIGAIILLAIYHLITRRSGPSI